MGEQFIDRHSAVKAKLSMLRKIRRMLNKVATWRRATTHLAEQATARSIPLLKRNRVMWYPGVVVGSDKRCSEVERSASSFGPSLDLTLHCIVLVDLLHDAAFIQTCLNEDDRIISTIS